MLGFLFSVIGTSKMQKSFSYRTDLSFSNFLSQIFMQITKRKSSSKRNRKEKKTLSYWPVAYFMLQLFSLYINLIYRIVQAVPCKTSFTNIGVPAGRANKKSINWCLSMETWMITTPTVIEISKITCSKSAVAMVLPRIVVILIEFTVKVARLTVHAAMEGNKIDYSRNVKEVLQEVGIFENYRELHSKSLNQGVN